MRSKILVIAEAGVNHNGDLEIARNMIDAAVSAGADVIKFQTFRADHLVVEDLRLATYQKIQMNGIESQYEMLKKLEMSRDMHLKLADYCYKRKIEFCSTPFDLACVDLLLDLGIERFKIPSGEITNLPLLRKIGGLGKKIIMSTGMAEEYEVSEALGILKAAGAKLEDITVLHCTTEYPAPFDSINLRAMTTIHNKFGVAVGYSDHSEGIEVAIAAAALGASVIEKHFTLDRSMSGPDHMASIEPRELGVMIQAIRNIEIALGNGIKTPDRVEKKNLNLVRRSIVARRTILEGEVFSMENIALKRAGNGISPMLLDKVLGNKALRNFDKNEVIEL